MLMNGFKPTGDWEQLGRSADYKVAKLARNCGVSVRTLQRYFQRHGSQVGKWLRDLRLKRAYERLRTGEAAKVVA